MSKISPRFTSASIFLVDNIIVFLTLTSVIFSLANFWHLLPRVVKNPPLAINSSYNIQPPVPWVNIPPTDQSKDPAISADTPIISLNSAPSTGLETRLLVIFDDQINQFTQVLRDNKMSQPVKISSNIYQLKTSDQSSDNLDKIVQSAKIISSQDDELSLLQDDLTKPNANPTQSKILVMDNQPSTPIPKMAENINLPGVSLPKEIILADNLELLDSLPRDQYIGSQWYLSDQKKPKLEGKKPIIVAVIDGGVDISHPDLVESIARDSSGQTLGWNYWDNTPIKLTDVSSKLDEAYGHGTHIAGTIGATSNNIGVSGSCLGTCQIMPLKVFGGLNSSGSVSGAIKAIDYAVTNGAKIINMSWGSKNRNPILAESIRIAQSKGVLIVAAAGNNAQDNILFPAKLEGVISVGSLDKEGARSNTSNYGKGITEYQPGVEILATSIAAVRTCSPDGRGFDSGLYNYCSGTSMATAVASGQRAKELWELN